MPKKIGFNEYICNLTALNGNKMHGLMQELKDNLLIELFKKDGSEEAMNLLCKRYWDEVNHFIEWKYFITSDKSIDATQDIFLTVCLKLENQYLEEGHFRAWLFTMVNNYMSDYFRKNKREIFPESYDESPIPLPDHSDGVSAEKKAKLLEEMAQNINEIVNALPPEKKDLIDLKFKESRSFQEIADMYGLKKSTCVKRIRMICKKIREEMNNRGFTEFPD